MALTTTIDPYPSRTEGALQILKRTEPVVHPRARESGGPLDETQLRAYEESGILYLPAFFSEEEVHVMKHELDELRTNEKVRQSEIAVTEALSGEIRSVFGVHTVSAVFKRLASDDRLLGMMRQILGSDVYLHQTRANYKPGFRGKEFYWHSDFETWHCEDGMPEMRAASISISLTPNYHYNGPLMVMPGSHRYYCQCEGYTPEDNYLQSLKKQDYGVPSDGQLEWMAGEFGIDVPQGPVGSVTLFDCNLMHGSNGNITPYPRSNVFFVYNSVENVLVEPFAAEHRRPWFLGNREPEALTPAPFVAGKTSPNVTP